MLKDLCDKFNPDGRLMTLVLIHLGVKIELVCGVDNFQNVSQCDSGRSSPSLDDLEDKKRKLLDALGGETLSKSPFVEDEVRDDNEKQNESSVNDDTSLKEESEMRDKGVVETANKSPSSPVDNVSSRTETPVSTPTAETSRTNTPASTPTAEASRTKTAGTVKTTLYGTPVLNTASSYNKLPSDDKFAKDICDVINFENLPNSTGKYKKICTLLKKVKSEVDRIQES